MSEGGASHHGLERELPSLGSLRVSSELPRISGFQTACTDAGIRVSGAGPVIIAMARTKARTQLEVATEPESQSLWAFLVHIPSWIGALTKALSEATEQVRAFMEGGRFRMVQP